MKLFLCGKNNRCSNTVFTAFHSSTYEGNFLCNLPSHERKHIGEPNKFIFLHYYLQHLYTEYNVSRVSAFHQEKILYDALQNKHQQLSLAHLSVVNFGPLVFFLVF
jgi:hypothetical protein